MIDWIMDAVFLAGVAGLAVVPVLRMYVDHKVSKARKVWAERGARG